MSCGYRVLPPPLDSSTIPQTRNPHKPNGRPGRRPQCRPHQSCGTQQSLHLTLQCPTEGPGLATHTLAGLCALWLPSAWSSGQLHKPVKPQPAQATCPARPQAPVQAPPRLQHIAEATFEPAVPHDMPRAGHSHTARALCAVVAEQRLHIYKTLASSKTTTPTSHLPGPAAGPSAGPTTPDAHSRGCI